MTQVEFVRRLSMMSYMDPRPDSLVDSIGDISGQPQPARFLQRQVDLALLAAGLPIPRTALSQEPLPDGIIASFREKARLLSEHRSPADVRIESFLREHLADLNLPFVPTLPDAGVVLHRHGIARALSLPAEGDTFRSDLLTSYRVANGVLHNPRSDRRTTAGTFHVAEGGLAVPIDKRAVPKRVFAELLRQAVSPPADALELPYHGQGSGVRTWASLLLRPLVCPEVAGITPAKRMEVRFFAPGTLISNLDFVESIFGNAGDPFLPGNDAGLDVEHWTGHTGCVILAPHLTSLTKKSLGLPHVSSATERQRRDRMCWEREDEPYNDGVAFKVTCRTRAGVIVTIVADNYYGYCKKEVKTQISYSANLFGNVEEEHAGGAIAFTSYAYGYDFVPDSRHSNGRTLADVLRDYADQVTPMPQGYGVDKVAPDLLYLPEDARLSLDRQEAYWTHEGKEVAIPLRFGTVYMLPSGFKLRMERHPGAPSYRIVGTAAEGTFCHKPCTVSGGGKSEISKSLTDYMLYGPIFVSDPASDLALVDTLINRDYSDRWLPDAEEKPDYAAKPSRPVLSPARSLGSIIKLLTPSDQYTPAYNGWLKSIPDHIFAMVFIIKRFHRPEWGADWHSHFSVDIVNGAPGHQLKFGTRPLVGTYLRVGLGDAGQWRTYKLRQDFISAAKIQTEDDITASVVVPGSLLENFGPGRDAATSKKFVANCEYRLFQRPDEAVHRGLDRQTEIDLARTDNFISNFEPIASADLCEIVARVTKFDAFSQPQRDFLSACAQRYQQHLAHPERRSSDGTPPASDGYVVVSSQPRLIDGRPSKNPRYLQVRSDMLDPLGVRAAEQGIRLRRAVPANQPIRIPVDAELVGRRNNPPEGTPGAPGYIPPLAVYNPIHYQELPELFMDFISSLTGKSPSTTGAGSEGALTKGPFNAVRPTADLNNALVSHILTGLGGFSTAAGHIGPNFRVDHDISLLVPEIWCRLSHLERDPRWLIAHHYLERVEDFDFAGERIPASRLGYRITTSFVRTFFGRVFDSPSKVFDEAILRPETQDLACFVEGIRNITEAHRRVAQEYLADGTIDEACPPLRALLRIMANGHDAGRDVHHPEVRAMFTREYLLSSDWYQRRLGTKQSRDVALWSRHVAYLSDHARRAAASDRDDAPDLARRAEVARSELSRASSDAYLAGLMGTLGADPMGE
jgi:hypothetical protein